MGIYQQIMATVVGSFLLGIGVNGFLIPHHFIDGGILGLALILHYFLNVPTGFAMVGLSLPICLLASKNERTYFLSSLFGLFLSSIFIDVLAPLRYQFLISPLTSAIIGGMVIGIGVGLMLYYKTSSGGTDLLAKMISKSLSLNIAWIIIFIDGLIVLAGLSVLNLDRIFYSCVVIVVGGVTTSMIEGR
ncbi:YitT family protein [Bacillus sp. JJ1764]|uniref:YitT family protein n=1 Tax=Bacillus sp. JJ1764 TaxID=3122964 RepID=UPI002FFF9005